MKVAEALRGVTRLAIDTSAFVDLVESSPRSALAWGRILLRVEARELVLISSPLMIAEALVTAYVLGSDVTLYEAQLSLIEQAICDEETARLAAEIGITYHLETTDALHVATALLAGCEALLTADTDFSRVRGYPLPGAPERVFKVILTQELKP